MLHFLVPLVFSAPSFAGFCGATPFTDRAQLSCTPNFASKIASIRLQVSEQIGCPAPIRFRVEYKDSSEFYRGGSRNADLFEGDFGSGSAPQITASLVRNHPEEEYIEITRGLITGELKQGTLREMSDQAHSWNCQAN